MVKKKEKIVKDNTDASFGANLSTNTLAYLGKLLDGNYSLKIIKAYADEMPQYILSDKKITQIREYRIYRRIPKQTYVQWLEKYDFFKASHEHCLEILASRRESGALYGEMKETTVLNTQHLYDPEWHEKVNVYRSELKKAENNQSNLTTILDCRDHPLFEKFLQYQLEFEEFLRLKIEH